MLVAKVSLGSLFRVHEYLNLMINKIIVNIKDFHVFKRTPNRISCQPKKQKCRVSVELALELIELHNSVFLYNICTQKSSYQLKNCDNITVYNRKYSFINETYHDYIVIYILTFTYIIYMNIHRQGPAWNYFIKINCIVPA